MSQILRIIKPEMVQICKFCGGHRNLHSHYETLRVPPDASQKDIRLAFIKLSKQMHPDSSKKANYTDFIRVNEAYQVLSKPHTRKQHDMDLQYRNSADGRPMRVVYYDATTRQWYPHRGQGPMSKDSNDYGDNYYSIKGVKRVSNLTIALLCLIISAIGVSFQMLAVQKSFVFRREMLLAESAKIQNGYRQLRSEVASKDQTEAITAMERKFQTTDGDTAKEKLQS